ncbi:scotin, isoform CRA_h [Rattus norvegicus]|uniref:Scotin, isoform CRA_h n=1 Tax=Rattus norvegicus TaxID=10116 RepID=A6I3B1_RAT|nr:scotin, isoform CRA_h [Rattus norvegicus]
MSEHTRQRAPSVSISCLSGRSHCLSWDYVEGHMYSLFRLQWLPGQGPLSTTHSGFSLQCLFTISQTYCLFFVSRCVIIGEVEILGSWRTGNLTSDSPFPLTPAS